jgi:hypothetical protein
LASDSTVRTALIYGSAAPQILEILTGPLSSNRFTDVEGEAFAKLLAENSDKVAECTEAALTGGTFKMDDSSELRLSCNLADDKTVYELHASFSEISVDLRFPLV